MDNVILGRLYGKENVHDQVQILTDPYRCRTSESVPEVSVRSS